MRGRTLDNAFIILDEAQNTTQEQMKMFLTRMGFESKMVITGDITPVSYTHLDAGKSTLVDAFLKQSGVFRDNEEVVDQVMDSDDIERERGITIYSKNCSVLHDDYKINIVDVYKRQG